MSNNFQAKSCGRKMSEFPFVNKLNTRLSINTLLDNFVMLKVKNIKHLYTEIWTDGPFFENLMSMKFYDKNSLLTNLSIILVSSK